MERGTPINTAFLALGSNKGDRAGYLRRALNLISAEEQILLSSSVYETLPFGIKDQDNFLNIVVKISTSKTIVELFHFIKRVEVFTGRTESVRWGPREIDIDLILYNEEVFENDFLRVPHKGIAERDFVLVPLDEIAPGIIIPGLKKSPAELLKKVTEKNIIRIFPEKIN